MVMMRGPGRRVRHTSLVLGTMRFLVCVRAHARHADDSEREHQGPDCPAGPGGKDTERHSSDHMRAGSHAQQQLVAMISPLRRSSRVTPLSCTPLGVGYHGSRLRWCNRISFGVWRSPVARLLWEQEVPGSNPGAPIGHHQRP
jgi:hypothetical protein